MKFVVGLKLKIFLIVSFSFSLVYCSILFDVDEPVDLLWDKTGKKTDRLIIFLPGLYDSASKFKDENFFNIARKADIKADLVALNINVIHLARNMMIKRIETDLFQYKEENGYKNIWIVGVSLGGLNTLLFYQKYEKDICGVILLAPYLADDTLVEEINEADGVINWQAQNLEKDDIVDERIEKLWSWLKQKSDFSKIYLGYGKQDSFIDSSLILKSLLNNKNVTAIKGGHDWETGQSIWQQQLASRENTGLLKPCR